MSSATLLALLDMITPTPPVASRTVNLVVWAVLCGLVVGVQVFTARRDDLPSLGSLVETTQRRFPIRWVILAGWTWLGWHTFVRGNWL